MGASEDVWGPSPEEKRRRADHQLSKIQEGIMQILDLGDTTEPIHPDHYRIVARQDALLKENDTMDLNMPNPDGRPGLIDTGLMLNVDRIDRLESAIDDLIRKIGPVLGPIPVEPTDPSDTEERRETSTLTKILDQQATRLYNLETVVRKITERIEL